MIPDASITVARFVPTKRRWGRISAIAAPRGAARALDPKAVKGELWPHLASATSHPIVSFLYPAIILCPYRCHMNNEAKRGARNGGLCWRARGAGLRALFCALLLSGCAAGPQGAGDLAGRQSSASVPGGVGAPTIVNLAERMRAEGDLSSAAGFYRRAIALDPDLVTAYIGLGDTLLAAGYPDQAANAFRAALKKNPKNAEAEAGLGATLVSIDQPIAAIEMLQKAIAVKPSRRAYAALGVAEDLRGDGAAAMKAYHAGLALAPNDPGLLNDLGLSEALQGDYDTAIKTLRRVASGANATARDRLNLALVLGLAGHMEEAAQVARIDLGDRAVRNNLAYYAELRAMSPSARATAILHPAHALAGRGGATLCNSRRCGAMENGDAELSAVPAAPIAAEALKPLAAKRADAMPKHKEHALPKAATDTKTKEATGPIAADAAPAKPKKVSPSLPASTPNPTPLKEPAATEPTKQVSSAAVSTAPAKAATPSEASIKKPKGTLKPPVTHPASAAAPQPTTAKTAAQPPAPAEAAANAHPQVPAQSKTSKTASSKTETSKAEAAMDSQNAKPPAAISPTPPSAPLAPATPAPVQDAPPTAAPHTSAFGGEEI